VAVVYASGLRDFAGGFASGLRDVARCFVSGLRDAARGLASGLGDVARCFASGLRDVARLDPQPRLESKLCVRVEGCCSTRVEQHPSTPTATHHTYNQP